MNVRGSRWRKLAYGGARYGPRLWVQHSPALFGAMFALALPEERERIRRSLRLVRGPRGSFVEALDVIRTFVAYAHCFTESLAADRPEARTAEPVVSGEEHLRAAIEGRRGIVMVTAHTGAWDAAARSLARDHGLDVMLVMAAESDERAREVSDGVRARTGVRVAHVGRHPLDALPVLRHLRRGGVVAVQLDRVTNSEAVIEVALCGRPFSVPEGPFQLARLSGAPLLPVFTRRVGYFRYEIVVLPAVHLSSSTGSADLVEAAGRVAEEMGRFLRESPTQWFHFSH